MQDRVREIGVDVIKRFFRDDFGSEARRDLWAEDGVFEMPFAKSGPMVFRGRQAIYARAKVSYGHYEHFGFKDIKVFPTIDPEVFFVTCRSEYVLKTTEQHLSEDYVNKFVIRDGRVAHRVEYFNAITHA